MTFFMFSALYNDLNWKFFFGSFSMEELCEELFFGELKNL